MLGDLVSSQGGILLEEVGEGRAGKEIFVGDVHSATHTRFGEGFGLHRSLVEVMVVTENGFGELWYCGVVLDACVGGWNDLMYYTVSYFLAMAGQ